MVPSSQPSMHPSSQPSMHPSLQPSDQPSGQPSGQPTTEPAILPTVQPSHQPTMEPSSQPTMQPSMQPSTQPSSLPTMQPSSQPSMQPTSRPTDDCAEEISNDCQREWENFIVRAHNDYTPFYNRCATEPGAEPMRARCGLCCLETFEITATIASKTPRVDDVVKGIVDAQLDIIGYQYQSEIDSFSWGFEEIGLDVLSRRMNKGDGKNERKNEGKSEATYGVDKSGWVNGGSTMPFRTKFTEDITSYQCPSHDVPPYQYSIAFSFFYDADRNPMTVEDYGENVLQSILIDLSKSSDICYTSFQVCLVPRNPFLFKPSEHPTAEPTNALTSNVQTEVPMSKLPTVTVTHSPSKQVQAHPTHMPVIRDPPPTIHPTSHNDAASNYSNVLLLLNSGEYIAQGRECMEDSLVHGMSTSAYGLDNVAVYLHYWADADYLTRQANMVQAISFRLELSSEVSNCCLIYCLY